MKRVPKIHTRKVRAHELTASSTLLIRDPVTNTPEAYRLRHATVTETGMYFLHAEHKGNEHIIMCSPLSEIEVITSIEA